jgi:hypothetical protein
LADSSRRSTPPAPCQAAGYARSDDPRDIREEFGHALEELGAWLPSRDAAELAAGSCLARALSARSRWMAWA